MSTTQQVSSTWFSMIRLGSLLAVSLLCSSALVQAASIPVGTRNNTDLSAEPIPSDQIIVDNGASLYTSADLTAFVNIESNITVDPARRTDLPGFPVLAGKYYLELLLHPVPTLHPLPFLSTQNVLLGMIRYMKALTPNVPIDRILYLNDGSVDVSYMNIFGQGAGTMLTPEDASACLARLLGYLQHYRLYTEQQFTITNGAGTVLMAIGSISLHAALGTLSNKTATSTSTQTS